MLSLTPVLEANPVVQWRLRELRNQTGVRRFMYTDHEISKTEHEAWLNSLRGNQKTQAFAVGVDGDVVGFSSFTLIDRQHKKADWAFYLDEATRGRGIGKQLVAAMLAKAFNEIGLEKLNCEILATNPVTIGLHKKFGFVEEGIRRKNVVKDGTRIDVHFLGILKSEWQERKHSSDRFISDDPTSIRA